MAMMSQTMEADSRFAWLQLEMLNHRTFDEPDCGTYLTDYDPIPHETVDTGFG